MTPVYDPQVRLRTLRRFGYFGLESIAVAKGPNQQIADHLQTGPSAGTAVTGFQMITHCAMLFGLFRVAFFRLTGHRNVSTLIDV